MNLINHCKYCGCDIVFLRTPRVFRNGDKAIPVEPTTLSQQDWKELLRFDRVEINRNRHQSHFDVCPAQVQAKPLDKLYFEKYHNQALTV